MEGKIVKAISGFYYVKTEGNNVYECRAKGAFKNEGITPLVGDNVTFQVTDAERREGMVKEIHPRKNELVRPAVANVDQAMVVFAIREPNPNFSTLDRFLLLMKKQNVPVLLVFNKRDLVKSGDITRIKTAYCNAGCKMFFISAGVGGNAAKIELFVLKQHLKNKVTVMAGPSGVGKSTLLNELVAADQDEIAAVGTLSRKAGRGKQTTRHIELYDSRKKGFHIIDTPGFTSLLVNSSDYTRDNLKDAIPEFAPYQDKCPFKDCKHIKERDCAVKKAVEEKKISLSRYNSYKSIYEEIGATVRK